MNVVIDTNILTSAIIKNSNTRKIILKSKNKFFFPEISLNELRKHKDKILRKSTIDVENYNELLNRLFKRVYLVPTEEILSKLNEAKTIFKFDPDDTVFIAAALVYNAIIWSNDKQLKRQSKIKVLNTEEMLEIFEN